MFISFESIENSRGTLYLLKDTDFNEIFSTTGEYGITWYQLLECYKKRNLNVVKNLILMCKFYLKTYTAITSIAEFTNRIMNQEPKLQKYKDELEKYLILE